MKILYLMSGAGLSGAEICLLRLATEIIQNPKHTVVVLNTEEGILNKKLRDIGIIVYVKPSIYVKKIYKISEILQLIKNIFTFIKIIKLEKIDIIHAFTLPLARRVLLLKKIGIKIPIVGTIHDELTIENYGKRKLSMFAQSINKNYEKLITVSYVIKQVTIENGGVNANKVIVIHNGVPTKENIISSEKKMIL